MAYSDFTLIEVTRRFGLSVTGRGDLFGSVPEVELPPGVDGQLTRNTTLALMSRSQKGRSEFLVAPLLAEFKFRFPRRVGLFLGHSFDVDEDAGLCGNCGYLLTRSPQQLMIEAPAVTVAETNDDGSILDAVPHALAMMVAAQRFNGGEGEVFGAVTTGLVWLFLRLDGRTAAVDAVEYPIQNPRKLFGILTRIVLGE